MNVDDDAMNVVSLLPLPHHSYHSSDHALPPPLITGILIRQDIHQGYINIIFVYFYSTSV